jgi:soluble lytic murein transglycosylase
MSNRVRHFHRGNLFLLLLANMAAAQTPELLDAVRVHAPEVAERSQAELQTCLKARCPRAAHLSLLTGYLELARGNAAGAVTLLSSRSAPPALEPFRRWYLGEAQAYAGAPAKARATLTRAQKGAPGWLTSKIELRLAELDLALGHPARARPILEAAAAASPSPELLLDRALARRAMGDDAKARADFKLIAIKHPGHPHAAIALRALEVDGGIPWTDEEQLARAQGRLGAGDASGCLAALSGLGADGLSQRGAMLKGQALVAKGREAEGFEALERAATGKSPALSVEALMTIGRRLMRQGDHAGASRVFNRIDATFGGASGADEAAYLAAWLAMSAGDDAAASAAFEAFEARHPGSRKRDEARWFRGFTLIRHGAFGEGRAVLRGLAVDFPRSTLVPQARYWASRAAQLLAPAGRPDAGAADAGTTVDFAGEYRELAETSPGSIYARLALERLIDLGSEGPEPFRITPAARAVALPPRLALAAELSRAGLLPDSQEEIEAAVGTVKSSEEALDFGHALQALGDFGAAHALAARYLWGAVFTRREPQAVALMYPRAWRGTVEQWAATHGVDPSFAWAIMRRESAFRPDVTSSADARGLMQLIPPTARQIAIELQEPPLDADELYSPDASVRLGTWYLSQLFRRLSHPGLVAAAYNGGPGPVTRWIARRGAVPFDQWIEEIPFKETRGYVKQVIADYYIYQSLYGDSVGRLSLVVPTPKATGVDF